MKLILSFLFLCGLIGVLAACSSVPANLPTLAPTSTHTQIIPSSTQALTPTPAPPSATETAPTPTETATAIPPTETPLPVCVNLIYGAYAQFEITGSSGQRVLVDVSDPSKLSSQATDGDILLTTHTHWDHWNEEFQVNFPGRQLFTQTGFLEAPGMVIQGIASAHNAGDRFKPEGGSNYIYLIDIEGIKIAHFGDIGQESLTEEQLAILERVDIAMTQINNPYSDVNADNRKGINLIEQVQPRLVIATHLNLDTVKLAVSQWDGYYIEASSAEICQSDLVQDGTQFLLMGESVETITKYVDLVAWPTKMDQE